VPVTHLADSLGYGPTGFIAYQDFIRLYNFLPLAFFRLRGSIIGAFEHEVALFPASLNPPPEAF
jgi:hypothetical protein